MRVGCQRTEGKRAAVDSARAAATQQQAWPECWVLIPSSACRRGESCSDAVYSPSDTWLKKLSAASDLLPVPFFFAFPLRFFSASRSVLAQRAVTPASRRNLDGASARKSVATSSTSSDELRARFASRHAEQLLHCFELARTLCRWRIVPCRDAFESDAFCSRNPHSASCCSWNRHRLRKQHRRRCHPRTTNRRAKRENDKSEAKVVKGCQRRRRPRGNC